MSTLLQEVKPVRASHIQPMMATPSTVRTRSGGIDAVRVIGLLAVIAGHVWLTSDALHAAIFPWHVPVFFFLTGYLWRNGRAFIEEAQRRVRTLLIPYVAWLCGAAFMYSFIQYVTADTSWRELGHILLGEVGQRPFHTFWFVAALLVVSLLYQLIAHIPYRLQLLLAVGALGIGSLLGDTLSSTPWSVGTALYCVAFTIFGALAKQLTPHLTRPMVTGLLLLLTGSLAILAGVAPVDLRPGDLGTPLLSGIVATMLSFGLVLCAEWLFSRLPAWCSRLATSLAAPALVVLLLHPLLLWLLHTPESGSLWQYLLIVAISWVCGLLIVRSPLAPWLAGIRRPNPIP